MPFRFSYRIALGCAVVVGLVLSLPAMAAPKFSTVHAFCAAANCTDGSHPQFGLVRAADGTLYGLAAAGGSGTGGVIFALTPQASGDKYKVIHNFNGERSASPLIVDTGGNLYGIVTDTGTQVSSVFELRHSGKQWKRVTLYVFCPAATNCADGQYPSSRLTYVGAETGQPYDGTSPLYGATGLGGANNGGVLYQLVKRTAKAKRREKVLYSFCAQPSCADGQSPGTVVFGSDGRLYGTAASGGGANNGGVVFRFTPAKKTETVLYTFCQVTGCPDGFDPFDISWDASGNLVGIAAHGGAPGQGVLFRLSHAPNWPYTELYAFCGQASCIDGRLADNAPAAGAHGVLYGATEYGGLYAGTNCDTAGHGCGEIYQFRAGTLTLLHSFCEIGAAAHCTDGANPQLGRLLLDPSGNLFGMTYYGGANGGGTIFELTP